MANRNLTAVTPVAIAGVNIQPMTTYDFDVKADATGSLGAISDVIYTPTYDLQAISPHCNRVAFHRICTTAAADTQKIQVSADGANWYTMPLYNGGTTGGTALSSTSLAECALIGLPNMRYVRGSITLAAAISGQTAYRAALSFMRF